MSVVHTYECDICGAVKSPKQPWFLVTTGSLEDSVRILEWDDVAAAEPGVHHACGVDHVERLISCWMLTASFDLACQERHMNAKSAARHTARHDSHLAAPIGELSVHRESAESLVDADQETLMAILDAIDVALRTRSEEDAADEVEQPVTCDA